MLIWYETFDLVADAIQREKSLKEWPRSWKVNLIERENPHWEDLYPKLPGIAPVAQDWAIKAAKRLKLDDAE